MYNRSQVKRVKTERCPDCQADVVVRIENDRQKLYNVDGSDHACSPQRSLKPIGQAVIGRKVEEFHLRDRRVTLRLDDGVVLEVHAGGHPLKLRLIGPDGIQEE
ncbi:MAG: hypothetical protein KJ604_20585 [Gammaproteobacteria bacterium]|nr:hypothetical protein [Gammaproteobacteria bacterium]